MKFPPYILTTEKIRSADETTNFVFKKHSKQNTYRMFKGKTCGEWYDIKKLTGENSDYQWTKFEITNDPLTKTYKGITTKEELFVELL